jgi:hypothetical protein
VLMVAGPTPRSATATISSVRRGLSPVCVRSVWSACDARPIANSAANHAWLATGVVRPATTLLCGFHALQEFASRGTTAI